MCLEIHELDPTYFVSAPGLAWQACLKKTEVKLELITDYDMMTKRLIRDGICQATNRYAKANNTYMKNCDKNNESLYLKYLDANNLYGWAMSQKLPVNGFKWLKNLSKFNEDLLKKYDKNSNTRYFLEVDIEYPKTLFNSQKDLPFLPEIKKVEKVGKLICSIEDKEKYVIHIKALKQALNHELKLKKVHRVTQSYTKVHEFNQKTWLQSYTDTNIKLKTNAKTKFEKDFFNLMNNSAFGKTIENVRNHRDMKLVKSDKRRKRLVDIYM